MVTEAKKDLLERIQELQTRLDEAEETLRALRNGEVDGIVVSGPDGDQVYTLKGADEAYRVMVENMAEGAVTLRPDGLILFSNAQFASCLGLPLERVIGSSLRDFVAADDVFVLSAVLSTSHRAEAQLRLKKGLAELVPARLSASRLWFDGVECICLIVTDLTEQQRNQEIVAAERLASSILDQAAGALLVIDPSGKIIRASRAAEQLAKRPVLLQPFDVVFFLRIKSDAIADATTINYTFAEIFSTAQRHGRVADVEAVALLPDGRTRDVIVSVGVLTGAHSACLGCIVLISDISGLRRVEQALRESENRERARAAEFQALMDAAPVSIFRSLDAECRWMDGNRAAYDLWRVPRGSNLSMTPADSNGASDFRVTKDGIEIAAPDLPMQMAAATGRAVRDYEAEFVLADGVTVNILGHAVPLLDESGHPRGVIGAFLDITGRKQAEEALRKSEERFRALITASSDALYRMSADWSEMHQLSGGNFLSNTDKPSRAWLQKYIHPDDRSAVNSAIDRAIRAKSIFQLEHRVLRRDGTLGWTFSRAVPLLDAKGDIVEWFGAASDITDRKRAEMELRESESRLGMALESGQMGWWEWDVRSSEAIWSAKEYELLGLPPGDARARADLFFERVHPGDAERVHRLLNDAIKTCGNLQHEFRVVWPDGQVRWLAAAGHCIPGPDGQAERMVGVNFDITERKQAEEQVHR